MPVSPLSEAALWRRPRLLMPAAEEEACHAESQPGTHPGEDVLEPRKQTEQVTMEEEETNRGMSWFHTGPPFKLYFVYS